MRAALCWLLLLVAPRIVEVTSSAETESPSSSAFVIDADSALSPPSYPSSCPVCLPSSLYPSSPAPYRVAYLVSVHDARTASDAVKLIPMISSPANTVIIHVDRKYPQYTSSPLYDLVASCPPCGHRFFGSIVDASWGEWSMLEPTLWAMSLLSSSPLAGTYDVFATLSGDSFPVYKPAYTAKVLQEAFGGRNVVTAAWSATGFRPTPSTDFPLHWHKRRHYGDKLLLNYTCDVSGESLLNVAVVPHFGSQWVFLTPSFVEYVSTSLPIATSLPHALRQYYKASGFRISDETYFATLLAHHPVFRETLPTPTSSGALAWERDGKEGRRIFSARYERMDEDRPNAWGRRPRGQRYDAPEGTGLADKERPWGPYFLGLYDLKAIKDSGCLFFRKVSDRVEGNLYKIFPKESREEVESLPDLSWSEAVEFKITKKPEFI